MLQANVAQTLLAPITNSRLQPASDRLPCLRLLTCDFKLHEGLPLLTGHETYEHSSFRVSMDIEPAMQRPHRCLHEFPPVTGIIWLSYIRKVLADSSHMRTTRSSRSRVFNRLCTRGCVCGSTVLQVHATLPEYCEKKTPPNDKTSQRAESPRQDRSRMG